MADMDALCMQVDDESRAREGAPAGHEHFDRLVRTIWRLRQPDGCPWDLKQTHASIRSNMAEEAYEAIDAIDANDLDHLCEELGDVLMQVVLHAQIGADEGAFDIDDVCRAINEKLVRRHPHVFGGEHAETAAEVLDIWDAVKVEERASKEAGDPNAEHAGLLSGVPTSLPALMQCQKISRKAAGVGFEWDSVADVWDQVASEKAEFLAEPEGSDARAQEFGDILFALVNVARIEGIDAEAALAASNAKFRRRWSRMEELAAAAGQNLEQLGTERQNILWNQAKAEE